MKRIHICLEILLLYYLYYAAELQNGKESYEMNALPEFSGQYTSFEYSVLEIYFSSIKLILKVFIIFYFILFFT